MHPEPGWSFLPSDEMAVGSAGWGPQLVCIDGAPRISLALGRFTPAKDLSCRLWILVTTRFPVVYDDETIPKCPSAAIKS